MQKEDSTLKVMKSLSHTLKTNLIDLVLVWFLTASVKKDVERAEILRIVMSYVDLTIDADRMIQEISENPQFGRLPAKEMCIELLRSLMLEMNPMLKSVDYIILQRNKVPVLLLKNEGVDVLHLGISVSIELADMS